MKHIGIMTWYFGANYGAVAQSIALYRTIKQLGFDCDMIKYRPEKTLKTILVANIPPKGKRFKELGKTIHALKKCIKLSEHKYITETKRVRNAKEIDALGLDAIVFGSDAIFNYKHPLFTPLYFGADIKTKKLSFSPSCEHADVNCVLPEECTRSLREMSGLSVRDSNTSALVHKNTGIEPIITLDPTFLQDFSDISAPISDERYLLVYSFSNWEVYKESLTSYAHDHGLKIISAGNQFDWADQSFPEASFEMWISAFRDAALVLTDSFHGTAFSLKNHKQIILCGRDDKKSKIASMLAQLDAAIDIYHGESVEQYLQNNRIDYLRTQKRIDEENEKANAYLTKALGDR